MDCKNLDQPAEQPRPTDLKQQGKENIVSAEMAAYLQGGRRPAHGLVCPSEGKTIWQRMDDFLQDLSLSADCIATGPLTSCEQAPSAATAEQIKALQLFDEDL